MTENVAENKLLVNYFFQRMVFKISILQFKVQDANMYKLYSQIPNLFF